MAKKPTYVLKYKYRDQPWKEYDRTQVVAWVDQQEERMRREHPNAEDYKTETVA